MILISEEHTAVPPPASQTMMVSATCPVSMALGYTEEAALLTWSLVPRPSTSGNWSEPLYPMIEGASRANIDTAAASGSPTKWGGGRPASSMAFRILCSSACVHMAGMQTTHSTGMCLTASEYTLTA